MFAARSAGILAGQSIFGKGLSVPLAGCPPASNCIEIEITKRAPPGQNSVPLAAGLLAAAGAAPGCADAVAGSRVPVAMAALASVMNERRPPGLTSLLAAVDAAFDPALGLFDVDDMLNDLL